MKYARLTSEQLEVLHHEFAVFLAVHGLDKIAWDELKTQHLSRVDALLDEFSDVVWQQTLEKASYVEHISERHIFMFKADSERLFSIIIEIKVADIDVRTPEGWTWLQNQWQSPEVHFRKGTKTLTNSREEALFELIQQGAALCDGSRYTFFESLIA
jgi:hypothetical protein